VETMVTRFALFALFFTRVICVAGEESGQPPPKSLKDFIQDELTSKSSDLQSAVSEKRYKEAAIYKEERDMLSMALRAADAKTAALSVAEGQQDYETCAKIVEEIENVPRNMAGLKEFAAVAEKEAAEKERKDACNAIVDKSSGNTGLIIAAKENDAAKARELIGAGADLDRVNTEGMTAFIMAARKGSLEVAQLLADAGANKILVDRAQRTALMWAAEEGHIEVAKLLVDAGASKDAADNRAGWRAALMWAADEGHVEVAKLLIDAGAGRPHVPAAKTVY